MGMPWSVIVLRLLFIRPAGRVIRLAVLCTRGHAGPDPHLSLALGDGEAWLSLGPAPPDRQIPRLLKRPVFVDVLAEVQGEDDEIDVARLLVSQDISEVV